MKNKITVTGVNIVFFIFVMLFMVFQVVLMVLTAIRGEDFIDRNIYPVLLVNQYILILIPVIVFMIVKKLSFKDVFRLNNPGLLPMLLIAACSIPAYFAAAFINSLVVYLLQFIGDIPSQPIPVPHSYIELLYGVLIVAVSPAVCEELLHRGLLLKAYEKRGTIRAIVITSVIFGFFHFDVTNFFGPVFLGILIGYYVIRTNSIFAGMLAHFLNNTIAEVLQYLTRDEAPAGDHITIKLQELGVLAIYGVVGVTVLLGLLYVFRQHTEGKALMFPPIASIREDIITVTSHWPMVVILVLYVLLGGLYILSIILERYAPVQGLNALSQISTFLL